jgi:hypothetical protein
MSTLDQKLNEIIAEVKATASLELPVHQEGNLAVIRVAPEKKETLTPITQKAGDGGLRVKWLNEKGTLVGICVPMRKAVDEPA